MAGEVKRARTGKRHDGGQDREARRVGHGYIWTPAIDRGGGRGIRQAVRRDHHDDGVTSAPRNVMADVAGSLLDH